MLTTDGDADISWVTRGTVTAFHASLGGIGFFPCDRDSHVMSITTIAGFRAYDVLVPDDQMCRVCLSEGMQPATEFSAVPVFRDPLMEASLLRLSTKVGGHQLSADIGDEIAARHIVLRICALIGGTTPDWHRDTSVFTPPVMRRIVERIDEHLSEPMSLENIATTVGLSPGHFARKFQHSAGLSLNRFMNKRRISTSFAMLREGENSLSRIALDLGFSSQSHFTRLFSCLTGITPQQFRRLHVRMAE